MVADGGRRGGGGNRRRLAGNRWRLKGAREHSIWSACRRYFFLVSPHRRSCKAAPHLAVGAYMPQGVVSGLRPSQCSLFITGTR